jgi:glycosyltransferase involved in cell wall biosynthesis
VVVDRHIKLGKISGLSMILEPTQGLTPARLCGVRNTAASWLAFIDDDCLLEPDWLAQAASFASFHPQCGAFGGKVILDWEAAPPPFVLKFKYSFAEQEYGTSPMQVSFLVGAGLVINRSAIIGSGWLDKQLLSDRVGRKLISGGDVEIALRIGAKYDLWYNPACKLRHFIPARRTSKKYLMNINYGLGKSQFYADSMLWSGSYLALLLTSILGALRDLGNMLKAMLKSVLGRKSAVEVAISLSFVLGKWAGLGRVLRMSPQERRLLLGCASAGSSKQL